MIGKPMKPDDMRACDLCGDPLMKNGAMTFFRVTLERMVVNVDAVRQIAGLTTLMRSEKLATIFAPDDVIARPVPSDVLICCDKCAMERGPAGGMFTLSQIAAKKTPARRGFKGDEG